MCFWKWPKWPSPRRRNGVATLKSSYLHKYKRYWAKIFSVKVNHAIQHFNTFWTNLKRVEQGHYEKAGRLAWNDPLMFQLATAKWFWKFSLTCAIGLQFFCKRLNVASETKSWGKRKVLWVCQFCLHICQANHSLSFSETVSPLPRPLKVLSLL